MSIGDDMLPCSRLRTNTGTIRSDKNVQMKPTAEDARVRVRLSGTSVSLGLGVN